MKEERPKVFDWVDVIVAAGFALVFGVALGVAITAASKDAPCERAAGADLRACEDHPSETCLEDAQREYTACLYERGDR